MKIIEIDVKNLAIEPNRGINLVLGYFDGVHLGHQYLIKEAISQGDTAVMTFDFSPNFVLGKSTVNSLLTSLSDKANIFQQMGVKCLYVLRMCDELLKLSKDDFINQILRVLEPGKIFVGTDYRFGHKAEGTPEYLNQFFPTEIVDLQMLHDLKISSRHIKEFVANGEMEKAKESLGRNYSVYGLVVEGQHNGEKIGFPTANIDMDYPYVLPKIGVYMGYVRLESSSYKALICVSTHPTIEELNSPIIEAHLLYYKGSLYGREVKLEFVSYMRDIFKFGSLEELGEQLKKDREIAKNALQE